MVYINLYILNEHFVYNEELILKKSILVSRRRHLDILERKSDIWLQQYYTKYITTK